MTEAIPSNRPEFFGKDHFTAFIGRVEDVNDPKQSGRVKVRCIGWHPKDKKGEDGLKTDDLPWARVGMPTTMAQQGRIGGKHGLLNGSWVFGFFLDGQEAQDPVILNTFNFTAKASDKDNRKELQGQDGKDSEQDEPFDKSMVSPKTQPNSALRTKQEKSKKFGDQNDPAGDAWNNDADNDNCGGKKALQSQEAYTRQNEKNKKESPQAQETETSQGDGMCGSTAHARDDMKVQIQKYMPSNMSRFKYGDAVWNKYSGNYLDLNGILAQLAVLLCNSMKQPINSSKSFTNELNRKIKSVTIQATPDRDGFIREKVEKVLSIANDMFNGIFQKSFVDILCSMMLSMLQAMNNNEEEASGDNLTGNIGASPNTNINNVEAQCISDTILSNVETMTDSYIELSQAMAKEYAENSQANGGSGDNGSGFEDIQGAIAGIMGGLSSVMQFPLIQKYAMRPDVFNAAGTASMDALTKDGGCRQDRIYNTGMGALGSKMGFGGGQSGGGSGGGNEESGSGGSDEGQGQGSSPSRGIDRYENVGFGGYPGKGTGEITNQLCPEAEAIPYKDGDPKPEVDNPTGNENYIKIPAGQGGEAISISLPSRDERCAKNFINGTPNQVVITRKGQKYFYDNERDDRRVFPSIFIRGYQGTPVPVVDPESGELVAILVSCASFDPNLPNTPITIIPDNSQRGILTNDPNYDIVLGGFFIANTGFDYCNPKIQIYDRDKNTTSNAEASLIVVDGRIVDYDIINNGTAFRRIPNITIIDDGRECGTDGGFGAKLYPIMSVIQKNQAKPPFAPVQMVYCPSNQQNLY
jgi:hypothetical protein